MYGMFSEKVRTNFIPDSSKFANGKHVIHLQFARSIEKTICFEAEESLICFNRNRISLFNEFHFIPAHTRRLAVALGDCGTVYSVDSTVDSTV